MITGVVHLGSALVHRGWRGDGLGSLLLGLGAGKKLTVGRGLEDDQTSGGDLDLFIRLLELLLACGDDSFKSRFEFLNELRL